MQKKVYFDGNSKSPIDGQINEFFKYKKLGLQSKLVCVFQEKYLLEDIDNLTKKIGDVIAMLESKGLDKNDFSIAFLHSKPSKNTNRAFLSLFALTKKFEGYELGVENFGETWSVDQVLNANAQLDQMATEIKSKDFSPAEAILSAYMKITQKKYAEVADGTSLAWSRSIYGVLNSDKIVCVGYIELLKDIVARLQIEDSVQIFSNEVTVEKDGIKTGHENCIIRIKDEKYGIDGFYCLDPTWDSGSRGSKIKLTHFLLPISEIENSKYKIYSNVVNYFDEQDNLFGNLKNCPTISLSASTVQMSQKMAQIFQKDTKIQKILEKNFNDQTFESIYINAPKIAWRIIKSGSPNISTRKMLSLIKATIAKENPSWTAKKVDEHVFEIYHFNKDLTRARLGQNSSSCFSNCQTRMFEKNQKRKSADTDCTETL